MQEGGVPPYTQNTEALTFLVQKARLRSSASIIIRFISSDFSAFQMLYDQ